MDYVYDALSSFLGLESSSCGRCSSTLRFH